MCHGDERSTRRSACTHLQVQLCLCAHACRSKQTATNKTTFSYFRVSGSPAKISGGVPAVLARRKQRTDGNMQAVRGCVVLRRRGAGGWPRAFVRGRSDDKEKERQPWHCSLSCSSIRLYILRISSSYFAIR
jgi:hypothetical protein